MKRTRPWNPRRDQSHWDFTSAHTDPRTEPGLFAVLAAAPKTCAVLGTLVLTFVLICLFGMERVR